MIKYALKSEVVCLYPPHHFVSWAGCHPLNNQSNHKIKSTRISNTSSYFKPVLLQITNDLVNSKKYLKIIYQYRHIKVRANARNLSLPSAVALIHYLAHIYRFKTLRNRQISRTPSHNLIKSPDYFTVT